MRLLILPTAFLREIEPLPNCPKPKHAPRPKTRAEWWAAKLERNQLRDRTVTRALRKVGWKVVRVWECDLARKHWPRVARRVRGRLRVEG